MLATLKMLVRATLSDARVAARHLIAQTPALGVVFEMAVVVSALNVIIAILISLFQPTPVETVFDPLLANPILFAIIQLMLLMLSALTIFLVGRLFGGQGEFDQALLLSVWVQVLMLIVQVLMIPVIILAPGLAVSLNMLFYFYFTYLMVVFIAELHGFSSLWKVFMGIIATSFALSFVVMFLIALIGLSLEGA